MGLCTPKPSGVRDTEAEWRARGGLFPMKNNSETRRKALLPTVEHGQKSTRKHRGRRGFFARRSRVVVFAVNHPQLPPLPLRPRRTRSQKEAKQRRQEATVNECRRRIDAHKQPFLRHKSSRIDITALTGAMSPKSRHGLASSRNVSSTSSNGQASVDEK